MPRDYTGIPSSSAMYSPIRHVVSNTMTKTKTNTKGSNAASKRLQKLENAVKTMALVRQKKTKKSTPFASAGTIAGRAIGGMFGNSGLGAGVGKWLGSGIGSIFGSGDYQLMGSSPEYNVLANGSQIPQFNTTRQTNVVCHREYLGDIIGTAGFNNVSYPLNPGISTTFPWLSSVAGNYQEYKFHGLVFEFRPLITDFVTAGAPGVVIMSTNYNSDVPIYTSKQQMENAEYAVSVKPTLNLMHGIECAVGQTILPEKYVRSGPVPASQDLRLYDLGNFQFATQANPIQDLGELWVSYCVEFFKPLLPNDVLGNVLSSHLYRTAVTTALPLGTIQLINTGQLSATASGTSVSWVAQPGLYYLVNVNWVSSVAYASGVPALGYVGLTPVNRFQNDTLSLSFAPPIGTTTTTFNESFIVQCTLLNPGVTTITFGTGTFAGATTVDIYITELDSFVTA